MKHKFAFSDILAVVGLVALLGMARGFDILLRFLMERNSITFSLNHLILGFYMFVPLLLAAALLLLFWLLMTKPTRNPWISFVYLLVGVILVSYPFLYFIDSIGRWFSFLPPDMLSGNSYLIISGGFIAMTGLLALVLPKGRNKSTG